jgi:ISXO2-like transposase domain
MGGYQSNRERRAKGSNKSLVFGMVERDGKLRAGPIPNLSQDTLESIVRGHVVEGTRISADKWDSYNDLKHGFELGRVNHSKKEWVVGIHHTNTIEGHWDHFKRAVRGTMSTSAPSTCGSTSPSSPIGAISATHTRLCLIALWPLSRCHVYKTCEIL